MNRPRSHGRAFSNTGPARAARVEQHGRTPALTNTPIARACTSPLAHERALGVAAIPRTDRAQSLPCHLPPHLPNHLPPDRPTSRAATRPQHTPAPLPAPLTPSRPWQGRTEAPTRCAPPQTAHPVLHSRPAPGEHTRHTPHLTAPPREPSRYPGPAYPPPGGAQSRRKDEKMRTFGHKARPPKNTTNTRNLAETVASPALVLVFVH